MKTVLLIEDNKEIRENTAEILELAGLIVNTASNGQEGIDAAIMKAPDVILCDIMMPIKDGFEVFLTLNKNPYTAGIPFLFLTAKSEMSEKNFAIKLGVDDYIIKPYDPDFLINTINQRVDKHRKGKKELAYQLIDYVKELEDMLFMTSHQVRAPLCRCQGLINLVEGKTSIDGNELENITNYLKTSLVELDKFTRELTFFLNDSRQKKIIKLNHELPKNSGK